MSDHQTMSFKDQSTIPNATFIEIGQYIQPVQPWHIKENPHHLSFG